MGIARFLAGAAALAACSSSPSKPAASWEVVAQGLPPSLMSVWASGPDDVWVVGGHAGTDGPVVEHYDGTTWTKLDTTSLGPVDLWWVTGFSDGRVFVGGTGGTIATTSASAPTFTKLTTPPGNVIVFGIWGTSSQDVWAVGGTGAAGGFAWHYDGSAWTAMPVSASTIWKVNGRASDDVWMSATGGTVLHWNGSAFETMPIADAQAQQANLFSIGASSQIVITVGATDIGWLYENTGAGWQAPIDHTLPLAGVAVSETDAYAVGAGGTMLHRSSSGWTAEKPLTQEGLHAAFIDPAGDVWAAGGNYNHTPTLDGVLLHKGPALQGSFQ